MIATFFLLDTFRLLLAVPIDLISTVSAQFVTPMPLAPSVIALGPPLSSPLALPALLAPLAPLAAPVSAFFLRKSTAY